MRHSRLPFPQGLGVALVTPFTPAGEVDVEALKALVKYVVDGGVDYLVALGTTAETPTLSPEEQALVATVISDAARAAGDIPVVIGCGGNDTAAVCRRAAAIDPERFAAALVVAPYYNKPTQRGLRAHFGAVAQASAVPVIVYNIPARAGVNILPDTLVEIVNDNPDKVIGVKEASGIMGQIDTAVRRCGTGGFAVIAGDDSLTLPVMAVGGAGVISVVANAQPQLMSELVHAIAADDVATARCAHQRLMPLTRAIFLEGNPAGIKSALGQMGICTPTMRLPLVEPGDATQQVIADALEFLKA